MVRLRWGLVVMCFDAASQVLVAKIKLPRHNHENGHSEKETTFIWGVRRPEL